jgi:hypothetical protein
VEQAAKAAKTWISEDQPVAGASNLSSLEAEGWRLPAKKPLAKLPKLV